MLHELTLELLRPTVGVGEIGPEFVDVEREPLGDRVVDAGLVARERGGVLPEVEILVVTTGGRGDDAEFESTSKRV